MESKWLGPRLLVSLSSSGLTGRVRELYGAGGTKKYHLNDLILYVERKDFEICGVKVLQPGMGTTPAVIGGHGGGEPGARALILNQDERIGRVTNEKWMTAVRIRSIS